MIKRNAGQKIKSLLLIDILICSCVILSFDLILPTTQASSTWNQTSYSDFHNGTQDNLTIIGKGNKAKLEINLTGIQTWLEIEPSNKPIARYSHGMAPIWGTEKVLLFGGYSIPGGNKIMDDTWIYDLCYNTWVQKSPANKPTARESHAMASVYGDDKVILFGGSSSWDSQLDDIWVYDLSDNDWTQKTKGPLGRYGHTMCTVDNDDKVIIFGGTKWTGVTYNYFNDTWVYDLSDDLWTEKKSGPKYNYYHGMASVDGEDKFVVFGGIVSYYENETWIYDYRKDKWIVKDPKNSPGIRYNLAMSRISGTDNILLFGGHGISQNNETWLYDLSENTWTRKKTKDQPSIRDCMKMTFCYGTDKVVLFGGYYYDFPNWYTYDDTWIYRHFLPIKNGTFVSSTYDCGYNSSFYELKWFAITPENTSVKLQLRTANNESNLISKDFIGPDGTKTTFYNASPAKIWFGHDGDRWVQYKAYLNLNVITYSPYIKDVTIKYNCIPKTIVISPSNECIMTDNKPMFTWTFEDYDSEYQEAFQVIIDKEGTFDNIDYDSFEQHTSSEQWQFPTGTNYTVMVDGIWYWKVRTQDEDYTWTEFSEPRKLVIDTHPPTSAPVIPAQNTSYNNLTLISGIVSDGINGTGINKVEIFIKNVNQNKYWDGFYWVNFETWLDVDSDQTQWSYDASNIIWTTGHRYEIRSRAMDNATIVEIPISSNYFRIDMESPISLIEKPKTNIYLNDLDLISGTSFDLSGSGVSKVEISIKCVKDANFWDDGQIENRFWDGKKWNPKEYWLPTTGIETWTFDARSVPWSTSNQYLIRSRAMDNTDNMEISGPGITIFYDSKPPDMLSIVINDDEKYTNSNEVILKLQVEDLGFGVSEMSFSTDGSEWSSWELFNSTRVFELPEIDGEKIVYLRVRDFAGNIGESMQDTIVLDTTPPKNLAIEINEGAIYTNSLSVNLNLCATDALSGLSEMSFSNDCINWQPWENFRNTRLISIPIGEGEKNVYFRAIDNADNIAEPVFDSIILDSTPPHSLTITINKGALETNSTSIKLQVSAYDASSGIVQMSFSFDSESWTAWEAFVNEKKIILTSGDGVKNVYFRVVDTAGNIASPISATILLNTTTPEEIKPEPEKDSEGLDMFFILSIIIIIALLIVSVAMVFVIKRRKRYVQELLPPGTITIKPGGLLLPSISVDEISTALKSTELPSTIGPSETIPTIAPQAQVLQLPAAQVRLEQSPQVPQVPQQLHPSQPQQTSETQLPQEVQQPSQDGQQVQQVRQLPINTSSRSESLEPSKPRTTDITEEQENTP